MRVGKTRVRLAKMIAGLELTLEPEDLVVNCGYNTAHWDCCSWNACACRNGRHVNVSSQDTMTELVRFGFDVTWHTSSDVELFKKNA